MMTLNIKLSDENWDGVLSQDTNKSVTNKKLLASLGTLKDQNQKIQIDFSIRIDYKTETSKFRLYQKSVERVSLIGD
jgi:hypothetical protein